MVFPKFDDEEVVETSESKPQNNVDLPQETADTTDVTPTPASTPNYTGTPIPVPRIQEIKNNYLQNPQRRGQREVSPSMTEGVENYDKYLRNPATGRSFSQREYNAARQDGWQIPEKEEDIGPFVDDILASAEELDPELVAKMIHNPRSTWRMIDEMDLPDDVADKAERLAKKLFAYNDIRGANPDWNIPDISLGYPMPKPKKPKTTNADVSIKLDPNGGSSEHKIFFADHQTAFDGLVAYKKLSKKGQAEAQRTAYDLINEVKKKINGRHANFVVAPKNMDDWDKTHRDMIISIMSNADQMITTARTPAEKNMAKAVKTMLDSYFKREYVRARVKRFKDHNQTEYENAAAILDGEKKLYVKLYRAIAGKKSIEKIITNAFAPQSNGVDIDDSVLSKVVDSVSTNKQRHVPPTKAGDDKTIKDEIKSIKISETPEELEAMKRDQQGRYEVRRKINDNYKEAMEIRNEEGERYKDNPEKNNPPRTPVLIMIDNATKNLKPEIRKEIDHFLSNFFGALRLKQLDTSSGIKSLQGAVYKLRKKRMGKGTVQNEWNRLIGSRPGLPTYNMLRYHPEFLGFSPLDGKRIHEVNEIDDPATLWQTINAGDSFIKDILTLDDKYNIGPEMMVKMFKLLRNPDGFKNRSETKVRTISKKLLEGGLYHIDDQKGQKMVEDIVRKALNSPYDDGFVTYLLNEELADVLREKNPKKYKELMQNPKWAVEEK